MTWQRLTFSMLLLSAPALAHAQDPTPITPASPAQDAKINTPRGATTDAATRALTNETSPYRRRSIVHHYPHPYPDYYHGDSTAGFRNPGGVGRYREYYPPGNQFEAPKDPVRVAKFDQGGGAPDRAEQLQAQQIGIQRSNSIQGHIDRMSRPTFGYGVGYFGGFY